jgi:hypothetical protein
LIRKKSGPIKKISVVPTGKKGAMKKDSVKGEVSGKVAAKDSSDVVKEATGKREGNSPLASGVPVTAKGKGKPKSKSTPKKGTDKAPVAEKVKKEIIPFTKDKHREWSLIANAVLQTIVNKYDKVSDKTVARQLFISDIHKEMMNFSALTPYKHPERYKYKRYFASNNVR